MTSYPSYGFTFSNAYENATSNLPEIWNFWEEGGSMNSRNHHMFGSVGSYFWSHLAGFRLSFQGELNIVPPRFFHDSHVSQLSASYRGHHVSWEALPACYTFSVTVAPNEWRRVNLVLPFSTCSLLQSTPVYLLPVE